MFRVGANYFGSNSKTFQYIARDEQAADYHTSYWKNARIRNIIITNHSMLLADLNRDKLIFNSLAGLVVDEAHQFVQTASRMNETVFSYTNWKYIMGQIGSEAKGSYYNKWMPSSGNMA